MADRPAKKEIGARAAACLAVALAWGALANIASADELNELSLEGWKQLREVERYQMQIAEKYYREQNWKVAAAEYEKYLSLYESGTGAPYAQLKWSLAQCQLRQQNTAIKEGFQSVIDYWPESAQATAAAYYIARTYKDIGRIKEAKKAYQDVLAKYPAHLAAVYSLNDLIDITTIENDVPGRVALWKKLAFEVKRSRESQSACVRASQSLAGHLFRELAFADAVKSLATTYSAEQLPAQVAAYVRAPVQEFAAQAETKASGEKLADQAIAWLKQQAPNALSTPETKAQARAIAFSIADLQSLARRDEAAIAAYEQMHKSFGPDDEILGRLAAFHKSRGNHDRARETYRRYADPFEGLGQVAASYREQKNYPPAIETYLQVAGQDSERAVRWKTELAQTYRQARKFVEAVGTYEELYKQDLANANRWRWEIATTYRDAGKLKEAIGNYRQCENFPENYKQMAWCHRQLKQPSEAIILYNQVASEASSAPWALLQIAYTREEAGQQEPAIQAFQLVCKKFPKDQHASQAHAHLQTKYKISVTLGGAKDE